MLKADRVVLVGDHRQLPPVFKADNDDKKQYGDEKMYMYKELITNTIFKQLYDKAPEEVKCMLKQQYRMHNDIANIVTSHFYKDTENKTLLRNGLTDEESNIAKKHFVSVNINNKEIISPKNHIYWINSVPNAKNNQNYYEKRSGTSMYNIYEVNIIEKIISEINKTAKDNPTVGVISFYSAQNREIRLRLSNRTFNNINLSVNTVDKFQGQERNIIIVSLVRSAPKNKVKNNNTFFKAFERLNVAFSRAQNLLLIIGSVDFCEKQSISIAAMSNDKESLDQEFISTSLIYKEIIETLKKKGCLIDGGNLFRHNNNKK